MMDNNQNELVNSIGSSSLSLTTPSSLENYEILESMINEKDEKINSLNQYNKDLESKLFEVIKDRDIILNKYNSLKSKITSIYDIFENHTKTIIEDIDGQERETNKMYLTLDSLEDKYDNMNHIFRSTKEEKEKIKKDYKVLSNKYEKLNLDYNQLKERLLIILSKN